MNYELTRYETALKALAECMSVDEVKNWGDTAVALKAYARMAKDKTMEVRCAEIKIRSERRLGELIEAQKTVLGLNRGGRPTNKTGSSQEPVSAPTLAEAGIDKKLSARAQELAARPEEKFEADLLKWRETVSQENARVTTRLVVAGALAQKQAKKEDKAKPSGYRIKQRPLTPPVEDVTDVRPEDGMPSADELLEIQRDNERLQAENAALVADDKNAELVKAIKSRDNFRRECNAQAEQIAALTRKMKFFSDQLKRCAKAIGVDEPSKVAPTLEMMIRSGQLQRVASSQPQAPLRAIQ